MWLILQQPEPDDFVIATGEYHTVREFATLAFKEVGIELEWRGDGINEHGIVKSISPELSILRSALPLGSSKNSQLSIGQTLVEVDPKYFRPAEVDQLLGNPAKAKAKLGWNPQKTSFEDLVKIMVQHDMKFVKKLFLKAHMDDAE
jgi:GDPmannose 4,6-dehydratase